MDTQQLKSVSDAQLCAAIHEPNGRPQEKFIDEAKIRKLHDCSNGELYCKHLGITYGSDRYADCRMRYDHLAMTQQAINSQQTMQQQQIDLQRKTLNQQQQQNSMGNTWQRKRVNCSSTPNYQGGYDTACQQ